MNLLHHRLRAVLAVLALAALLYPLLPGYAAAPIRVFVDDTALAYPDAVGPRLNGGRVFLPFRAVGEAMGAVVDWQEATQTLAARRGGYTVQLQVGNPQATVNGAAVAMDAPATLSSGRVLVPVRFFGESLGAAVMWDEGSRSVRINTAVQPPAKPGPGMAIAVVGSETFRNKIATALELLSRTAPGHFAEVTRYLHTISEGEHSGVDVFTGNFTVGYNTVAIADQYWLASTIVHDAHHAKMYADGRVFSGEAAEKECIENQKDALLDMQAPDHYQAYLDQVASTAYWEVPYADRNW